MDEEEPLESVSEASVDAKRAFFGRLDAYLTAEGHPVPTRVPPAPPPDATVARMPAVQIAPAALVATADSPEFTAAMLEAKSRLPFMPPAPEPTAPGKRAAKTVQSKVVPRGDGRTMALDAEAMQRPTPSMPFVGSASGVAPLPVPNLTATQYVSLRVELTVAAVPREETLRRYWVATEAVYRALVEQWRHPARRAEIERAMAAFGVSLWRELLG